MKGYLALTIIASTFATSALAMDVDIDQLRSDVEKYKDVNVALGNQRAKGLKHEFLLGDDLSHYPNRVWVFLRNQARRAMTTHKG